MSSNASPHEVIAAYAEGLISQGEVLSLLLDGLSSSNVGDVVASLPPEWREMFIEHLQEWAKYDGGPTFTISGTIYRWEYEEDRALREHMRHVHQVEQAARSEQFARVILPAIRAWLESSSTRLHSS